MRLLPLLLTACLGGRSSSPAPPVAPAEPEVRIVDAVPKPAKAVADVPAAQAGPPHSEIASRLPGPLALDIRQVKSAFDGATTAPEVAGVWKRSLALAIGLEAALSPAFEASDYEPLKLDWLLPSLPGMSETYMAEGMALVFSLDSETWKAKAATTESPADDAFFELLDATWGSARPMGWANWDQRTWDYGGCSGLGHGVVLDVLHKVDTANAAGPLFKAQIAETRAQALRVILEDNEQFPRCNVNTMQPTADEALQREARSVLDTVALSPQDKAAITARLPKLLGQPHTGG